MKKIAGIIFKAIGVVLSICLVGIIVLIAMATKYNGTWCMDAYGLCFDMNFGIVKTYEVTNTSYTRVKTYDGIIINGVLYSGLGKLELNKNNEELNLTDNGSQVKYISNKMPEDFLKNKVKVEENNPKAKFKMFYETFNENYAFADMYNVDFNKEFNKYDDLINDATDDETLFKYMSQMISGLNDGHVYVRLNDKTYAPCNYVPDWITDKEKQDLLANVITKNYVKDYYKFNDCKIRYGTLRDDIGYIIMQGMGVTKLNKVASTKNAMNKIIKEFQDKKTIVIDLRFNSGGYDEASLLISGYFTSEPYLAYKKQAFYKGDFNTLQDIYVYPSELKYDRNIVIITSGYTISAAETFIRAMKANPNNKITLIGDKTAGFYSDAIPKFLPGGFEFAMSTERYYSYDGSKLEGNGIVPDVHLPVSVEDAKNGIDKAFDWILANY